ncbi:MAG TPA: ABC transporter permease [Candidatus Nitrosotalea sp.]|nr:ABC transporter permease [Candidatus Nitrosotalea sp.]
MNAHLGAFARSCWFQYRAMFNWATPIGYLSYKLLQPVGQILFFTQLGIFAQGRSHALYFALGNAIQLTAINGVFGVVMTVANERQYGTLPLLLGAPQNRLVSFLGRATIHILDGISGVVVGLIIAVALYGLDLSHADIGGLAICIVLVSFTTAGLGLMFGSVGLIMRDVMIVGNTVYYLMLVVCGVNIPVDRLPHWLQLVSYSIPMTRGIEAARLAVAGQSLERILPLLAGELAVGVLYAMVGYALLLLLENRARRGGLQEAY